MSSLDGEPSLAGKGKGAEADLHTSANLAALVRSIEDGDKASVAIALNLIEDRRPEARDVTRALVQECEVSARTAKAHRIGITGPPGVGKSSLCAALARELRALGRTVAILAVDPSSVQSGGALLGDRARMGFDPTDKGIFVRSFATQGESGGVMWAVPLAARVASAAYDVVLIETTGVGQTEIEIAHVADAVVLVVQPGSGDVLQFIKAGIMEVPDLLVVNKADQGSIAERAANDLKVALASLSLAGVSSDVGVVLTSARDGLGVAELVQQLTALRNTMGETGIARRRGEAGVTWTLSMLVKRIGELGVETLGGMDALGIRVSAMLQAGEHPLGAVRLIEDELRDRFRGN